MRGIQSEGMICSYEELGIEDKSDGIAIISEEIALKYKLGNSGALLLDLDDYIFDLAITANRPDGMSVIGIAREISALLETKFTFPSLINKYHINVYKNFDLCNEAITKNLKVMDQTSLCFCRDNNLSVRVFNADAEGAILEAIINENTDIGTLVEL